MTTAEIWKERCDYENKWQQWSNNKENWTTNYKGCELSKDQAIKINNQTDECLFQGSDYKLYKAIPTFSFLWNNYVKFKYEL